MDFKLFSATTDKMINTIKSELFDVSWWSSNFNGCDHLVVREMMALPALVKNGITCMHPSPARTATVRHARMRACLCTRTVRADHVQNGKTKCLGTLEQQCQKSRHALLCPPRSTHVVPNMLHIVYDIVC